MQDLRPICSRAPYKYRAGKRKLLATKSRPPNVQTFPAILNTKIYHTLSTAKMDEVPVDRITRASGSGQSHSQPYYLCQACLLVLTRVNLVVGKFYSYHTGLKDFVEASRLRRYICSWLFDALPEDDQETLGLLAEGKIPDYLIPQVAHYAYDLKYKAIWDPPSFLDERAAFLYALFLGDEMGEDWGKENLVFRSPS